MDFTPALPTFIITLREGVEAALVVGLVLACLQKAGQTQLKRWVYGGVLAGILGSLSIGIFLGLGLQELQTVLPQLEAVIKPILATLFGFIAIIFLSWMLVWMTKQSRSLKGEIETSVRQTFEQSQGSEWSIFSLVCIAVLREGFETVLFLFTNLQPNEMSIVGVGLGALGAVLFGLALFQWGIRIDLKLFFKGMGLLLLLIVAGLVVSVCHNFDVALSAISQLSTPPLDLCIGSQSCILGPLMWDASAFLSDRQMPGVLLKVLLGYRDHFYLGQLLAYSLFLGVVGSRYFSSLNPDQG
jgi:high-affinity iron transporter